MAFKFHIVCDVLIWTCYRYEKEEADGTDSTVYSTAVALAIMGCFQVRVSSVSLVDNEDMTAGVCGGFQFFG